MVPPEKVPQYLAENDRVKAIPTRWVTRPSQGKTGVRGDLGADGTARTDSPTCSRAMLTIILSYAASKKLKVKGSSGILA